MKVARYAGEVSQDHHFLPRVYLRQWCDGGGRLLRYRRIGPAAKLERQSKVPKEIAYARDLYALPEGGVANELTGNGLENLLAREVDEKIAGVVARIPARSGRISDPSLIEDLRWLMVTFAVRSPSAIQRGEDAAREVATQHSEAIGRMLDRARTEEGRAKLRSYQDERMPSMAARAGVAAFIKRDAPGTAPWLDGDTHVVAVAEMQPVLEVLGAGEFTTFEDPVVVWESNSPYGLLATFAASPAALVVIVVAGTSIGLEQYADAARLHWVGPLPHRQSLISRTPIAGAALERATLLRPTVVATASGPH